MFKAGIILIGICCLALPSKEQGCGKPGQSPSNAVAVCGTIVYDQEVLPVCIDKPIPAGRCGLYHLPNNYWYRFTCIQDGLLGIQITPKYPVTSANLGDDYNWQLFDISGHAPDDVYTDPGLFRAANWSGTYGVTGTSSSETDSIQCASPNNAHITPFSRLPLLQAGHQYLLLVTHFTPNNSLYELSFAGGNAGLENSNAPFLAKVTPLCNGRNLAVTFSKRIRCSSLAADGSDFWLQPGNVQIRSAATADCDLNCSFDSLLLTLDGPLPPGSYHLSIKTGSDGNSLLDACNNAAGPAEEFSFLQQTSAPLPSIMEVETISCHPAVWKIRFNQAFQTASLDQDGSDFLLSGPGLLRVRKAEAPCPQQSCDLAVLTLSGDPQPGKSYELRLQQGLDGNSLTDACNQDWPGQTTVSITAGNCSVLVPTAFTPNGDGHNDLLRPLNTGMADENLFRVYNRYGELLYSSNQMSQGWDGTWKGKEQPVDLYIWTLRYKDRQTGRFIELKGTCLLIR